jgi:hypothetical protein
MLDLTTLEDPDHYRLTRTGSGEDGALDGDLDVSTARLCPSTRARAA